MILIEVKTTAASFGQLSFPADKIKRKDKEPQIWKGDREGFGNTHGKCLCKKKYSGDALNRKLCFVGLDKNYVRIQEKCLKRTKSNKFPPPTYPLLIKVWLKGQTDGPTNFWQTNSMLFCFVLWGHTWIFENFDFIWSTLYVVYVVHIWNDGTWTFFVL